MIVVDSNVLAALAWATAKSEAADHLWKRDPEWHAPVLILSELRSVALKVLRKELCSLEDCLKALALAQKAIRLHWLEGRDAELLRLAKVSGLSAYDSEFVHLAETLDAPLLTWDAAVLKAFPDRASSPEAYLG